MTKKKRKPCEGPDLFAAAGLSEQTAPRSGYHKCTPGAAKPSRKARGKTSTSPTGKEHKNESYLRDSAVAERYGVARQTVWRWAAQGTLPKPVKLSEGVTRWRMSDLCAHEASRPTAKTVRPRSGTPSKGRGQQ